MPTRLPFVGELSPLVSPLSSDVTFSIKRLNSREVMTYRNANSQVRYIMEDNAEGRVVSEKDYPMGDMRMNVVSLGLADWNLTDAVGQTYPINSETILTYLDPEEIDAIYDKVLAVNPILSGESARKNS